MDFWAVVVAQLEEQMRHPTPEVWGSNPIIGKFNLLSTVLKRRKLKEAVNGPFLKKYRPLTNWPSQPLLFASGLFQINNASFTTNEFEQFPSSIWCWDSNSQSLEHESLPMASRPRHCLGTLAKFLSQICALLNTLWIRWPLPRL